MTQKEFNKLTDARYVLCNFCENKDFCEHCQVTLLMDQAYAEYKELDKEVDIENIAKSIVNILEDCDYNNPSDSSGYFTIKRLEELDDWMVDVYKSTNNDNKSPHYVIYCRYDDGSFDYVFTEDLSLTGLIKELDKLANVDY